MNSGIHINPLTFGRAARSLSLIALLSLSVFSWQLFLTQLSLSSLPTCCNDASSWSYSSRSTSTSKVNNADVDANAGDDVNESIKHAMDVSRKQKLELRLPLEAAEEEDADLRTSLGVKPRAFPLWQNGTQELPCEEPEALWRRGFVQGRPTTSGILYVKVHKTGSSTSSAVTLRIASRLGAKRNVTPLCRNRVQHARAHNMRYIERNRRRSILWSMVRDPTSRAVSQFFHFEVSRHGVNATDANFQEYVKRQSTDFQMNYLSFHNSKNRKTPMRKINEILQNYDFIGVSERREESIVALQMILGLETADVMYISSKVTGSFNGVGSCYFFHKSYVSPNMKSYFVGEEWQNIVRSDQLLYRTVNRSLDLTIEQLGRNKFEENLHKLRVMQKKVDQECLPTVRLPCNMPPVQQGDLPQNTTDCIYNDMGCGFECMDRLLERMKEEQEESITKNHGSSKIT